MNLQVGDVPRQVSFHIYLSAIRPNTALFVPNVLIGRLHVETLPTTPFHSIVSLTATFP